MKIRSSIGSPKGMAFVFVLALLCIFWGLGTKPIYKTQEIRVAETAREMAAGGDWVIPHYNGNVRLRKPPLAYWLTASSYLAFGKVTEFTARFASAAFALLNVLMLFVWLRRSLGAQTALMSVICFMSSYIALRYFRSAETDSILLFFVTAACIVVYRMVFAGASLRRVLGLHVLMGLGFLTKGPAAIAMPLSVLLYFCVRHRTYEPLRKVMHPLGLLLLGFIAFGWYAAIYYKLPDVAAYWVGEEVDATYLGARHVQPIYWYVHRLFAFFVPWSIFIIPAAVWLYRARPLPPAIQLALVWFVATFIILTLNPAKQMQYALLFNTPFAILIGHYLAHAPGRFARGNQLLFIVLIACGAIAAVTLLIRADGDIEVRTALTLLVGAAIPIVAARLLRLRMHPRYPVLLLVGLVAAVWVCGQSERYAEGDEAEVKRFALATKPYEPLYLYGHSNVRVSFYADRVVRTLPDTDAVAGALVRARGPVYVATQADHASEAFVVHGNATKVLEVGKFALWKLSDGSEVSAASP